MASLRAGVRGGTWGQPLAASGVYFPICKVGSAVDENRAAWSPAEAVHASARALQNLPLRESDLPTAAAGGFHGPLPAPRRPWWIRDGCPHFTDSRVRQQGWESLCSFHPSLLPSHEGGLPQTQYLLGSRHILPGSGAPPLLLSETLYKPANSPSASRPSRRAWERQRCRPGQLSIHALV